LFTLFFSKSEMNGDERTLALKYTKNVLAQYYIFPRKLLNFQKAD